MFPGINEGMFGGWSAYSEHIFLYILAAGTQGRIFNRSRFYYAMKTYKGSYKGETFIFCGSGAAYYLPMDTLSSTLKSARQIGSNWFDNSRRWIGRPSIRH